MTVEPGFGGQSFMADVADAKLGPARAWLDPAGACEVQVDGGGRRDTAAAIGRGGTDVIVAGSALYRAADMAAEVERDQVARRRGPRVDPRPTGAADPRCAHSSSGSSRAEVRVDGAVVGAIGPGLLVLLGIGHGDDEATADALAERVCELRDLRGRRSGGRTARCSTSAGRRSSSASSRSTRTRDGGVARGSPTPRRRTSRKGCGGGSPLAWRGTACAWPAACSARRWRWSS